MFQFPAFALLSLCIQVKSTCLNRKSSIVRAASRPKGPRAPADRSAHVFARAKTLKQLTISDCQVGFPIRTSRDQRVLSPPPGLSQSATSFIASCCQGIHQTPLSRLIRSRRRQALLCGSGSSANPSHISGLGSLRPDDAPSAGNATVANSERSRRTRRSSRSVCIRLGKTVSSVCRLRRHENESSPGRRHPTRPNPHSGRTSKRLVFCSLHDVNCLISRSDRKTHPADGPANLIASAPSGRVLSATPLGE